MNARVIHHKRFIRKILQGIKPRRKGFPTCQGETAHPSGIDVFSSSLLVGFVVRLREILFQKILTVWRSSLLKTLLASFARDFTTQPLVILALFFSSYLFVHILLIPHQGRAWGKVVIKGFLVLLPLSGLLVKVDLKSLLSSSLISKAWRKTLGACHTSSRPK